ncbi:hypothetical protein ES703_72395 [subsurface metagenome]
MRGPIDAARKAGDDNEAGGGKIMRQNLRKLQSGARRIARADDRDHRPHQRVLCAANAKQGRRIVDHGKPRRIEGFARRHQIDAELLAGTKLGARIFLAANASRPCGTAAPRQLRQPLQRGCRIAAQTQQRAECARPDIVRTDQPQPV